ncbi:MAG: TIGR03663 family protein [Candidatus Sumerlaeota bacterium]|nr:TIGR03663 family protein [Candidatus Sumerlaeota bacterium]
MISKRPNTIRRLGLAVALAAAAAGALALRLPRLEERPMHGDEAVHAVKFGALLERGYYHYDPEEFHGPTLYYLTLPVAWFRGERTFAETTEWTYRIVPVVFGVGLILLLPLVVDGLSAGAVAWAAALTALSPAMAFYNRYYIQETLFLFFTFGALACGWRHACSKRLGWALAAGAFVGLMYATKETWVFAWLAILLAMVLSHQWARRFDGASGRMTPPASSGSKPGALGRLEARTLALVRAAEDWVGFTLPLAHLAAGAGAALAVWALFFSSFFTDPWGLYNSVHTYYHYFLRSGGAGMHTHPWWYYLGMLIYWKNGPGPWWSEGLILALAAVGIVAALRRNALPSEGAPFDRFLAFYALVMVVLYSAIPYKTPWTMLSFLHALILMAGIGAAFLVRALKRVWLQAGACILLALGLAHLGTEAWRANFVFYADVRNPYVYAHPTGDVIDLEQRVEEVAQAAPDGYWTVVKVISPEYWPLPWYLRRFERVGYWSEPPADPDAPILIVAADLEKEVNARLQDRYVKSFYGLRPQVTLILYVRRDLWRESVKPAAKAEEARAE